MGQYLTSAVLLIDVTNDFAVTNTLTIGTGTKLQIDASADAPSSGRLEMSVDGGVTWTILDDKLITVIDPNPTYTWSGATSGVWTLGSNWSGGTAPSLNNGTENIIIPNGCLNYPTLPAALWSINNLTIDTAANLSIGANNLTINGAFNNNGTLIVSGAGRPSKMDKDSGTVRYTVLGGLISEFGTPDFYNLVLLPAAAGTFTTSGTLSIANNLTIGVNATLDIAALDLGVTGSFTNSGRLRLNGVAAQSVSAPTINSAASFIEYYGGTAGFTAGNSYANLSVSGGTRTATAGLAVSETVTVALGATLDLSSYALTGATTFTNNGTVRISDGGQTVAGAKTNGASSTVQYYGTGAGTGLASWGTAYNNLTVNGAGNYPAGGSLTVASALTVSGGTISGLAGLSLSAASIDLSSAAAFALDANGGTFQLAATGGTNIGLGAGAGAFQLTNAELLKIRASGLTIAASGAGAITSDTVVTTGATHGTLTLSGASSITFSGGASTFVSGLSATTTSATANALSVATSLTATAGDIALTGGTGNLAISAAAILGAAAGTITVQASGAGTVNLGANLTLQAALISQPAETIAMGANALTLRADEINFAAGASVTGIGALAIDTLNAARPILLLAPDDLTVTRLNLTLTDLSAFAGATYASLTLGRSDGTGTITTNGALSANLPPLIFEGDDAIANLIQVDALINSTTAGRSISFRAPVRLGANVSTNNALIEFQRAVVVRDGTSPIISSGAGAGDITFLAAATINGVAAGGNETLSLNSGTGAVNLGSAIGGNASLYDLSVTSGAALALPAITLSNNLNATTTVGGITDNGTLIIPGAATLSVPLAQSVSFDLATNDFGTFAVSQGLNASVVDVNGIIIGTTTLAGTLGVSAGGAITDSGAISVALASSFATTAGNAAITLNDGNTFSSTLALNPNGAGNASVTNAVSNLNLAASTVGGDLTLSCLGAVGISDTGLISVSGNSSFTVAGPASIILDTVGNTFTGTLTFAASAGTIAGITIFDTTAVTLPAFTITGNLVVNSGGLIDQSGAIAVGGTSSLTTGAFAITLGNPANDFGGALAFTNSLLNNVSLRDMNALVLAASSTGGNLSVIAGGDITDSGTLSITGSASFETWNNGGANITIDDDGIGPITGNFATVILRSMDAAGAALRGGTLILREASATVIDGLRTSGAATLQSAGTVTDALAAVLEASPLTIISVGGTTLDSAACALTSINVTNTGSGTIDVANTAANLAVTGLSQGAGAAVSISNTGAGTLTISGALTASVAASPLSLSAADMDIAAAITSGTNTVNLFPLPVSTDIFLGGAGAGLSLSQAELNNIATSGLLSIGSAAQTGTITINGNVALTGPTGPVSLLTNGAAITAANNFATAAVAGTNLTLNARAGAANTGSVSGGGLLTAGTAGAANLTVNAGAGINLTNVGNLANVVTLANSTSGNIAYYNNRAMTLIAANSAPGATLSVINATGTLTSSGAIMTTGGGAASITLSSAGGLVLSNAVTAGGTGFVTLLGAGATQAALITAPGGLRLGGTGNFILNQNNVLATLAANVTGNLNLTVTAALAIGTVDTISGVTIGLANTLTLTTGGALTQSQPIIAATGTFVLTNTTANTDLSTNDNQIATFGTLSAAGRIVRVRNTIASVQSGAITASALELTGGASFTWTQATNNIATLAASIGAFPLSYRDADAITIGFVGATNGITANAFTLVAGGTVSQTEPINVGALTGTLTVRTLNTPGAAIDLVTAGNEAAIVDLRSRDAGDSAPANGAISYIDATGFDIAALRTTTTATIESGGAAAHDLSQTGDIAVGGLLTITAGLGDAVFSRATNTLATVAVPSAAILSLNDADGYTLQACNTSGAITATTAAGNITVSGALSTVAGAGMGIDLNPAGTITLSLAGTVAATDGGLVRLRKAVALTQNTTIDTDAAGGSTAAGAVQFDAGISGPLFALVVDASADGGGANGAVTFAGVVATLASLTVTGDSFINGGTITTSVSGQTYTGPVVLGADTTFTAAAGQLIHFAGTLGGTATARAISIPAGNVRFDGTVGGVGNLVSTLSITAPSTTALNANITTSGNQIFGGAVTLGANSTVISGAGTMTFSSTVGQSGSRSLTIQNGTATGAVTLAGAVTLDSYVLGNGNYSVAMNGTGSAVANNVAFLNQGTLSLGQALGTITFNGGVSTTGNPTNPSTVTILGTIASSDDPITLGAITLGENATVTSAATTTAGDIILGAVTGGIFNLNLSTGNGIANADITASNFNGSASLALANVGGTAIFSGTVSAGTVAISNTNTATFSQAVTATNMTVPNTVTNVSLNGALGTITNMVAFLNSGTLSLGQAAGTLTFNGGFTTSGVGGTVTTYGTLLTSNDTITLGAITLGADTTLDTAAASAAGSVTLGAVTGGAFTLIISTSDTVGSVTQSSGTITATSLRIQTGGAIGTAGTPFRPQSVSLKDEPGGSSTYRILGTLRSASGAAPMILPGFQPVQAAI
ncbi:hypothetical protein MASR2M78_08560 [Treponema sp.]